MIASHSMLVQVMIQHTHESDLRESLNFVKFLGNNAKMF